MKKLKFEEGVIAPFWLKDLEYMQECFEEVLSVIMESLSLSGSDSIISGCEINHSGTKVSMTEGWAYFGGEILKVEALPETEIGKNQPEIYFTKKTEEDDDGKRNIFREKEETLGSPYVIDFLKPSVIQPTTFNSVKDFYINKNTKTLAERIAGRNRVADTGLVTIETEMSSIQGYIEYRQIGGVVQLYGSISTNGTIAGIPAPATKIIIETGNGNILINSNGLTAQLVVGTIRLDNITYLSDPIFEG